MPAKSSATFLARLRRSSRLAMFMVLVFALKIGVVVTCTAHDILDVSSGAVGSSAALASVDKAPGNDPGGNPFDLDGPCEHCGCHQTIAIMPVVDSPKPPQARVVSAWTVAPTQHIILPKELRPPIV
ncbi:hypothetical protein [Dokdonella sp.]|uniref:hypothetical protein n=1 Tax=Dokdonella sp. TaxID=2291710 RepID=UPI003BAE22C6